MNPWWPTITFELQTAHPPGFVMQAIAAKSRPAQSATSRLFDPGDTLAKPFEGVFTERGFSLVADPEELGHLRIAFAGTITNLDSGTLLSIKMSASFLILPAAIMFASIIGPFTALVLGVWVVRLDKPAFFLVAFASGAISWLLPAMGMRAYLRSIAPRVTAYFASLIGPA